MSRHEVNKYDQNLWGSSYFFDKILGSGETVKNHYIASMAEVARYAVSSMDDLSLLMPNHSKGINRAMGMRDIVCLSSDDDVKVV
jgi:hypothetical protein